MWKHDKTGRAMIMDNSFELTDLFTPPVTFHNFNMHEFNIINEGRTAMSIMTRSQYIDVRQLKLDRDAGWVLNTGFREFDVSTGETLFEWWALDHLSLTESSMPVGDMDKPLPQGWNWL
jgi:hypothetical protein